MQDFKERNTPESKLKRMQKNIEKSTGSYRDLYEYRTNRYLNELVTYLYFIFGGRYCFSCLSAWHFLNLGILTGQASVKTYLLMTILGLGIGLTSILFPLAATS
jgi:hypothetical protein